ncbi:hypothetical protein SEA_KOZIE_74 [Microbacterium phage Kozie]|uniref:Uncharacterized protein n=1 Tax=Microbacterium phage Kozie TaxID=2885981 RepID=A0AAE8Y852_9CAUD|nr:hypothetical protein QC998_gp74 [Microbacterium phage Kozie]UDL16270.1 hypothetical protein SEA_KOZIE_74 [Microbacterium phage Kozie]
MTTRPITLEHADLGRLVSTLVVIDGVEAVPVNAYTIRPLADLNAEGWAEPSDAPEPEADGVRYPDVDVTLTGIDSHPFAIIKAVSDGLRAAGVGARERDEFRDEALGGDYDNVIQTAMRWVNVS